MMGAVRGLFRPVREEIHAVNDISFAIERGEVVGFVGPNGAGKSTTIKMLSGILHPSTRGKWLCFAERVRQTVL